MRDFAIMYCDNYNLTTDECVDSVFEDSEDLSYSQILSSIMILDDGNSADFDIFEQNLLDHFGGAQAMVSKLDIRSVIDLTEQIENEPQHTVFEEPEEEIENDEGDSIESVLDLLNDEGEEDCELDVVEDDESTEEVDDQEYDQEFKEVINYFRTIDDDNIKKRFISVCSSLLISPEVPKVVSDTMYEALVESFRISYGYESDTTVEFLEHFMKTFSNK